MARTNEEIKLELGEPVAVHSHGGNPEPHMTPRSYLALEELHAEALAFIQRLQEKNEAMHAEIARLQAERDAAVALIPHACAYCKWYGTKHGGFFPDCKNPSGCKNVSGINTGWEWRGVQKEE